MKNLFYLFCVSAIMLSCDERDRLSADVRTSGPEIVGFEKAVANFAYFSNVGVQPNNLPVIMQGLGDGKLPVVPITVSYAIDVANSTATKGVEFDFADNSGKVTIPAGGSFANIPLLVNTGLLNPTQATTLVLNLTSTSSGVIGEQYKKITVKFVGCNTALEGSYNTFFVVGTVNTANGVTVLTKTAPNSYKGDRFIWPGPQIYFWEFTDVCKELEIFNWQFQGSNPLFKAGEPGKNPIGSVVTPGGNIKFDGVSVSAFPSYTNRNFLMVKI